MEHEFVSHEDGRIYEFHPEMNPVITVEPGTTLTVETIDSLEGAVQSDSDRLESIPDEVNAATGPIGVEGATPGDILEVEIESVRVAEDRGRVVTTPGFGLLQDDGAIDHPSTTITPVSDGTIAFEDVSVTIDPVIGTIGVAPADDTYSTLVPHDHGGNLDTTDMTAGTTAYFPVFQEGGLLAMGDSKAAMADGEMCGTGAEIATEIDLTVDVIADPAVEIRRPLVQTSTAWKTIASAETLEAAVTLANRDLLALVEHDHGFDRTTAYKFSSLVGGLEISQVVDPLVTVRNAIPSEHLSVSF